MAASVSTFIKVGCLIHEANPTPLFKEKLGIIASQFSSLQEFKSASMKELSCVTLKKSMKLTPKEKKAIEKLQNDINVDWSIEENFIRVFTKKFIAKQLKMIEKLTIETLNANPLLCYALKFDNAKDFVKYYAYQAVSRSIVTSMGYFVQDLLLYSNEYIYDGKKYSEGEDTKFDLVIDKDEGKIFFEIKSGFNDLDKGQIKHYFKEISNVENQGNKAYIGITYGKRDAETVTTGLLGTYVEDWEEKILVGRELWGSVKGFSQK